MTRGSRSATNRAAAALARFSPHEQRHLFARSTVDGRDYARAPIRTRLFVSGDSLADGLDDALARRRARARRRRRDQREGRRHLPGALVPGRRGARAPARAHAVEVRRPHRVGHRPRHPRHHGARDPRSGRGAHPRRHRGRRGHQAVRREGRLLPGRRSRGARHRRTDAAAPSRRTTATPRWVRPIPRAWRRDLAARLGVGVAVIDANDIGVNVLGVSSGVDATRGRVAPPRQPARPGRAADPGRAALPSRPTRASRLRGVRVVEADHRPEVGGGVRRAGTARRAPGSDSAAQIGSQPSPGCQSTRRAGSTCARTAALCSS